MATIKSFPKINRQQSLVLFFFPSLNLAKLIKCIYLTSLVYCNKMSVRLTGSHCWFIFSLPLPHFLLSV